MSTREQVARKNHSFSFF